MRGIGTSLICSMDLGKPWYTSERQCPTLWAAMLWTKGFLRTQASCLEAWKPESPLLTNSVRQSSLYDMILSSHNVTKHQIARDLKASPSMVARAGQTWSSTTTSSTSLARLPLPWATISSPAQLMEARPRSSTPSDTRRIRMARRGFQEIRVCKLGASVILLYICGWFPAEVRIFLHHSSVPYSPAPPAISEAEVQGRQRGRRRQGIRLVVMRVTMAVRVVVVAAAVTAAAGVVGE